MSAGLEPINAADGAVVAWAEEDNTGPPVVDRVGPEVGASIEPLVVDRVGPEVGARVKGAEV